MVNFGKYLVLQAVVIAQVLNISNFYKYTHKKSKFRFLIYCVGTILEILATPGNVQIK